MRMPLSASPTILTLTDQLDLMFGMKACVIKAPDKNQDHVEVSRDVDESHRRYFRKRFLRSKRSGVDYQPWTNREFALLNELKSRRLHHVQQYRGINDLGTDGQQLETWDAGPDGDQWQQVPVIRHGARLPHLFMDCAHWFSLGRWLLVALEEVHALGFVHIDLKGDNFCLPAQSWGVAADGYPERIQPQWTDIKLIDVAFSLWEKRLPLDETNPLPIGQSTYCYQSKQLLAALTAGSSPTPELKLTRQLDWRVDLYSLGFVLGQILRDVEKRYLPADHNWGWTEQRHRQAKQLIEQLQGWDRTWIRPAPTERPHRTLIDLLDRLLSEDDLTGSLANNWEIVRDPHWQPQDVNTRTPPTVPALKRRNAAPEPTPVVPSTQPPSESQPGVAHRPPSPVVRWLLVLLVGAALSAGVLVLQPKPPAPSESTSVPVVTPPPAEPRAYLTVRTIPATAQVQIMNIGPAYRDGIELLPGNFDIQVSAPGYQTYRGWRTVAAGAQEVTITLQAAVAEHPALQVFHDSLKDGTQGPALVVIPAGEFLMGSPNGETGRNGDERQHPIKIEKAFALSQTEVTFAEYDRFCEATNREKPSDRGWGRGQRPVINVSWQDAVAYAEWLTQQTGQTYRLPTEAEWEYAARARTTTPFWTGRCVNTDQANYDGNYSYGEPNCGAKTGAYRGKTLPIGSFAANPWKLYDTMGNVWEWTCSAYQEDYDGGEEQCESNNYTGPLVVRGGSWVNGPAWVRSASRFGSDPPLRSNALGFRLSRSL